MNMSTRRVKAIARKELREYRHNQAIVATMALIPLVVIIKPLIQILQLSAQAGGTLSDRNLLLYLLAVPALVPVRVATYAVVGERQQSTLEPMLGTPTRRREFLLGKALAAFIPSVAISFLVDAAFVACVMLFAGPGVASELLRGPEVLALALFTPLVAAWSIWAGIAISARCSDVRVAQQLGTLVSLLSLVVTVLIAVGVIPATLDLALGLGAVLVILDGLGWRIAAAMFNRERLVTGTR